MSSSYTLQTHRSIAAAPPSFEVPSASHTIYPPLLLCFVGSHAAEDGAFRAKKEATTFGPDRFQKQRRERERERERDLRRDEGKHV